MSVLTSLSNDDILRLPQSHLKKIQNLIAMYNSDIDGIVLSSRIDNTQDFQKLKVVPGLEIA